MTPVCGSLYERITELPASELPYHFYTDHHVGMGLLCFVLILPLSIPKEISIQKYIRSGDPVTRWGVHWSGGSVYSLS